MTQNTFTDLDLQVQVEQYLAAGEKPDHYDVTGIVDMIIQFHGVVPLDSLSATSLNAILTANDISERYETE